MDCNLRLGVTTVQSICGTDDFVALNVILGSFGALVSNWPLSKTKNLAIVRNCNLGLREASKTVWGTFDLVAFSVI